MNLAGIKRGPMTADEKAVIERLAATLKKPTAGKIANRLSRHPATVAWYMIQHGLIERTIRYGNRPGRRNGRDINPFTPEQDRRLVELRASGKVWREVAAVMTSEFGIPRTLHSCQVRGAMLAAYDGGPESDLLGRTVPTP